MLKIKSGSVFLIFRELVLVHANFKKSLKYNVLKDAKVVLCWMKADITTL